MEDPLVLSEMYEELRARVTDDPGAERYLTEGSVGDAEARADFARLATWHACSVVLDSAQERLPGQQDLMALLRAVKEASAASADAAGEKRLSYDQFGALRCCGGGVFRRYLSAGAFLSLHPDASGRVLAKSAVLYVTRAIVLERQRASLSIYDLNGSGAIGTDDLANYVLDNLASVPGADRLPPLLQAQYAQAVAARLTLFLDPCGRRRVRLADLLASPELARLHDLLAGRVRADLSCWYSVQNVRNLVLKFRALDGNGDGWLEIDDLADKECVLDNGHVLSHRFVEAMLLLKCGRGRMDFASFVQMTVALAEREAFACVRWLFRAMDMAGSGELAASELRYYLEAYLGTPKDVDDVAEELMDLAGSSRPGFVSLRDLEASGNGHLFCSILIDQVSFSEWDNRESG